MAEKPEYTCAMCGGTFTAEWTDDEARDELAENFPGTPREACDVVCDDCYQIIAPPAMQHYHDVVDEIVKRLTANDELRALLTGVDGRVRIASQEPPADS